MDLFLTEDESVQLETIGERYQYAQLLWNIAIPGDKSGHYTVHPADAWEWKDVVDKTRGFLPLAQGGLKKKLTDFYERIG